MDSNIPLSSGKRVRSERFGVGTVELDKGATVIVRFDHGIEECECQSLTPVKSVTESIDSEEWDLPLAVANKTLAASIMSVNDAWGVFSRSRIALLPHQLWVCRRVLSSWPARWLVADDVGLGKTIEAGLILWPLLSKGLVRRLLILCPASLVEQWQYRLRTMFDIRMAQYVTEADSERSDFWATHSHVVASLETLRLDNRGRHQRLIDSSPWDLLIVDEAHHLNADEDAGPTLGYRLVQQLVDEKKVTSIIFFTGTPHRGKNFSFLSLLCLLRPDLFNPRESLKQQLPRLREVIIRNNKQNVTDLRGQRLFHSPSVTSETYVYSPEEAHFYQMLTEFILTGKAYASTLGASDQRLVILILIAMQKLASSSVVAIRRSLRRRLERLVEQRQQFDEAKRRFNERLERLGIDYLNLETSSRDDELGSLEEELGPLAAGARLMEDEEVRLRELLEAADRVQRETKFEKILSLVESRFVDRSVLFFTEYKATQSLLMSELISRFGEGCVAFINGDSRADGVVGCDGQVRTIHQTREAAAEQFNGGRVRFLISTEAGGEGIDLQEKCYSLVHVDLPWNPMRLHQRVGRLNRYGQKERVEVITLRNPDTVEARIWDRLNEKIENIMLAFGHVMEEPEDLLQMVLGMTSPALFRELFADASEVPAESLAAWFDEKTATFGGRDVIATVQELVGNCDRFDFQTVGKEVPPVDLPDLRPFMEAMLVQNHRRPRQGEDGSLTFKTPEVWLREVGVRSTYEGLVFDRNVREKDAVQRVVGIGHKVLDQAIRQALEQSVFVTSIKSSALERAMTIARVTDRVTGSNVPVRSFVVGLVRSDQEDEWTRLRDWEVVRRLNEVVSTVGTNRKSCAPPDNRGQVTSALERAIHFIEAEVPKLGFGFRVPSVEVIGMLWPGDELPTPEGQQPVEGQVTTTDCNSTGEGYTSGDKNLLTDPFDMSDTELLESDLEDSQAGQRFDQLLYWASARAEGSWGVFAQACHLLRLVKEPSQARYILRRMILLGHVECSADGSRWSICPATVVRSQPGESFLCGQRTPELLEELSAHFSIADRPQPSYKGPTHLAVSDLSLDEGETFKLKGEAVLTAAGTVSEKLATVLPDLEGWQDTLAKIEKLNPYNYEIAKWDGKRFSVCQDISERANIYTGESGMYHLMHKATGVRMTLYFDSIRQRWLKGDWYGLHFLAYQTLGTRCEVVYDIVRSELRIPIAQHWPLLYERALVLSSGFLPRRNKDAGMLIYQKVPVSLSSVLAEKLNVSVEEKHHA